MDKDILDKKIPRLLITLKDREESYGNYYGYSLYRMLLLKAKMKKLDMKNYAYSLVDSNFYGHFKDLSPERSAKLDVLSTKSKLNILRKSEVKMEGLLTYPEIATKLFKSIDWVRRAVSNLKIQPARVIERVKYFDVDTLNKLSDLSDVASERPDLKRENRKIRGGDYANDN